MRTNLGTSPTDHALAPDSSPEQAATTTGSTAPTLQDYRARYEKLCKEFLGQKQMLVPLLQGTLPDFRKLSSDKILACLISDPIIDKFLCIIRT